MIAIATNTLQFHVYTDFFQAALQVCSGSYEHFKFVIAHSTFTVFTLLLYIMRKSDLLNSYTQYLKIYDLINFG